MIKGYLCNIYQVKPRTDVGPMSPGPHTLNTLSDIHLLQGRGRGGGVTPPWRWRTEIGEIGGDTALTSHHSHQLPGVHSPHVQRQPSSNILFEFLPLLRLLVVFTVYYLPSLPLSSAPSLHSLLCCFKLYLQRNLQLCETLYTTNETGT